MQTDLAAVEAQIAEAGDIPRLLQEVRRKRIERVWAERAARREACIKEQARKKADTAEWRRKTLPFLGEGVSKGLVYDAGEPEKLAALGLPLLTSASDVAAAIGIEETELAWLTYHRAASSLDHYSRFAIPKKRGGTRVLSSPKRRLRVAQNWLLEHILAPLPVHEAAAAFRPGLSVVDNAARHTGRAVVARIDLKDFFPSVTLPRVRRLFREMGYSGGVATLFALLATEAPRAAVTLDGLPRFVAIGERSLPQGACTSPALTNLLCRRLDSRLAGAAEALGFRYSRYADDLVFSHTEASAPVGILLALARCIIADVGSRSTRRRRPFCAPSTGRSSPASSSTKPRTSRARTCAVSAPSCTAARQWASPRSPGRWAKMPAPMRAATSPSCTWSPPSRPRGWP